MKAKRFDTVEMKRRLQREAEQKLSSLSEKEQLELLAKKFGHLRKTKKVARESFGVWVKKMGADPIFCT